MKKSMVCLICWSVLLLTGCGGKTIEYGPGTDQYGYTKPTQITAKKNAAVLKTLPFHDTQDFKDAKRGFIGSTPELMIKNDNGKLIWDQTASDFISGDAPASVNPSLWRQAKLNSIHGLFKVTDNIYQIRGNDIANMTLIQGKTGWIIVDTMTSRQTAEAAFKLFRKHLGDRPIKAILFTHSHMDHFGGILGIISPKEAKEKGIRIIAPLGFIEEATSENILAGSAMGRRADFMYGLNIPASARGHVDTGLGKAVVSGSVGILPPTELVDHTLQEKTIDGIKFVFQYTPESEAPAEFTFYLPEFKSFCGAEVLTSNMHNLYTLRGAKVRDALKWSGYIDEALDIFGDAEIFFSTHHWPKWGNDKIVQYLKTQRDTYKYIHDQSVRLFNKGYTPAEIADQIKLPQTLKRTFHNQGYYGTIRHNSRAIYQGYLGWYDGNPANLNPLPPTESSVRYVELMGGADQILQNAEQYFDKGEYRFVAQLLNHLVFAQPDNNEAKQFLAKTYDQLGYQAESGPWRDEYLTAAWELRHGTPEKGLDPKVIRTLMGLTPVPNFFDAMAARVDAESAEGKKMAVKIVITDLDEAYELILENSVLHHRKARPDTDFNAVVSLTHDFFIDLLVGDVKFMDLIFSDEIEFDGNRIALARFFSLFEKSWGAFNIVTP